MPELLIPKESSTVEWKDYKIEHHYEDQTVPFIMVSAEDPKRSASLNCAFHQKIWSEHAEGFDIDLNRFEVNDMITIWDEYQAVNLW